MKKKLSVFATALAILPLSFSYLNQVQNVNHSQYNNRADVSTHEVSDYDEFKQALEVDSENDKVIVLEEDIDLSVVDSSDLEISNIKGENIVIDGNGNSIKNKNSSEYLTPIISFLNFHLDVNDNTISNFTVRNITLDNVGSFIGYVDMFGIADYTSEISDINNPNLIGQGLTFQNITIKNNKILNSKYTIEEFNKDNVFTDLDIFKESKGFGFLVNNLAINHSGGSTFLDSAVTFQNIVVKDNNIEGNEFTFLDPNNQITTLSSSFLANLNFLPSTSSDFVFNTYISYQYIFISNNVFKDNTIKVGSIDSEDISLNDFNSLIFESFGNLSGNANGSENWVGSGRTYLYINDIYVQNNYITESKKVNGSGSTVLGKYQYSELISNSNEDLYDQHISLLKFENIFSLNNEAYFLNDKGNYELYSQNQINSINISVSKENNNFNDNTFKNFVFYGKMYDESNNLNLFKDFSIPSDWVSYYGRYLFTDTEDYNEINNFFRESFGIYSYENTFVNVNQENKTKTALNSVLKVEEEKINILSNDFVYEEQDGKTYITKFTMDINYYQPIIFDEDGILEIVDTPFTFSDLKIYNNTNKDDNLDDSELVAINSSETFSINSDYSYSVELNLINEVELTQEFVDNFYDSSLDNLYFVFDYSNFSQTKIVTGNSVVKMDPDQLVFNFPGFAGPGSSNGNVFIIIGSIIGLILLLILLIILILLFKREREKKAALATTSGNYYNLEEEKGIDSLEDNSKNNKKAKKAKVSKSKSSKSSVKKSKSSKNNDINDQNNYYQNNSINEDYNYDQQNYVEDNYYNDDYLNDNYYDNSEIDEYNQFNNSEIDEYNQVNSTEIEQSYYEDDSSDIDEYNYDNY